MIENSVQQKDLCFTLLIHGIYIWRNSLQWRHNEHDSVSNHQPHVCFFSRLFRHRSKKTSKLHVTGLCAGNSPEAGEFPAQMASNAENVSIWWRHHAFKWRGSMLTKASIGSYFRVDACYYYSSLHVSCWNDTAEVLCKLRTFLWINSNMCHLNVAEYFMFRRHNSACKISEIIYASS